MEYNFIFGFIEVIKSSFLKLIRLIKNKCYYKERKDKQWSGKDYFLSV